MGITTCSTTPPPARMQKCCGLRPAAHFRPRFVLGGACTIGFALVVQFLAFGHRDFALDAAAFEVNLGRNERQALLASLAPEFLDFFAMQQQLAIPHGGMVFTVP